eukprot:CAMPEP_0172697692 /NCGR_PEP_ID=MMETSP1074-20121228/28942_1 /TAXON_ID=2916 /ORGANISM="Ceratium fusus, Strain PA161109" /LENGTH=143 /DNA_ID=CAMNT_0013518629 /DNA_START=39 /DNA_END=470 /DNA_ORIENTATION=+
MFECIILLPNRQGYTKWVQCDTSPGPMLRNTLLPTCHAWPLLDIPCVTNSNLTVGNFSDVTTKESDGQLQCLNAAFFACFFLPRLRERWRPLPSPAKTGPLDAPSQLEGGWVKCDCGPGGGPGQKAGGLTSGKPAKPPGPLKP